MLISRCDVSCQDLLCDGIMMTKLVQRVALNTYYVFTSVANICYILCSEDQSVHITISVSVIFIFYLLLSITIKLPIHFTYQQVEGYSNTSIIWSLQEFFLLTKVNTIKVQDIRYNYSCLSSICSWSQPLLLLRTTSSVAPSLHVGGSE